MTNSMPPVQGAAGGLSFAAEIKGEPGAMPVLLAHGGGQTRQAWKGVADDLANAGFRALARHAWRGDSDLRVDYHRPTTAGPLLATGRVIKCGPQISTAGTVITGSDGKLLSSGRGTYI